MNEFLKSGFKESEEESLENFDDKIHYTQQKMNEDLFRTNESERDDLLA